MTFVSIGPTPSVNVDLRNALGLPALEALVAQKADLTALAAHAGNVSNPHGTNAAQVNAYTTQQTDTALNALSTALNASLVSHVNSLSNPHAVTKAQVGLSAVDNTSDEGKPVSTAQSVAIAAVAATIPSKVSQLQNDSGFISSVTIGTTPGTVADGKVVADLGGVVAGKADTADLGTAAYALVGVDVPEFDDSRIVGALQANAQLQASGYDKTHLLSEWFADLMIEGGDLRALGFVGTGQSRPLSTQYATLSAAQATFPRALSLAEEIDGHAIQRRIDQAGATNTCIVLPRNAVALTSFPIDSTATKGCGVIGHGATIKAVGVSPGAWRHGQQGARATGPFYWRGIDLDTSSTAALVVGLEVFFGASNIGRGRCLEVRDARFQRMQKGLRIGNAPRKIKIDNLEVFGPDISLAGTNGASTTPQPYAGVEVIHTSDATYGSFTYDISSVLVANYDWGFDFQIANSLEGVSLTNCRAYNGWGLLRVNTTRTNYRSLMWSITDCDWQGKGFALDLNGVDLISVKGGFWIMDVNIGGWAFPSGTVTDNAEYRLLNFRNVSNFDIEKVEFCASGPNDGSTRSGDFVIGNFDALCERGRIIGNMLKTDHAIAVCAWRLSGASAKTIYEGATRLHRWWGSPPITLYAGTGVQMMQLSNSDLLPKNGFVTEEGIYTFSGSATYVSDAATGNIVVPMPLRPDGATPYFSTAPIDFQPQVRNSNNAPNYFQIISKTASSVTVRLRSDNGSPALGVTVGVDWTARGI